MTIKLRADVVQKFDPSYVGDAERWFSRYELYVDISEGKTENEQERSMRYLRYLPVFLAGDVWLCYEEMYETDKATYGVVKAQLCEYYSMDSAAAYTKFCNSKFEPGSSVDAFIAQLRKYAGMLSLGKYSSDKLILEQFLRSVPQEAAMEIRGRCGRDNDEMQLSNVLKVARHLPSLNNPAAIIGVITERPKNENFSNSGGNNFNSGGSHSRGNSERQRRSKLECYVCGEEHMMKDCSHLVAFRESLTSGNGKGPVSLGGLDRQ